LRVDGRISMRNTKPYCVLKQEDMPMV
jgi:hypothetical protein